MTTGPEPLAEIGLLIYPDCQLSAVHGLTDLFRIAHDFAGLSAAEQGATGPVRAIRVSHWQIDADGQAMACVWDSDPERAHRITHVIAPPSIVAPDLMESRPVISDWLTRCHAEGSVLCSVCAGSFVLADTGLMNGRRATTHWAFARMMAARFPEVELAEDHMVLDDGDLMTAGGILAWTDLGLTLVERLMGPSVMMGTAHFLLVDPPKRLQRPYACFVPNFDHGDAAVLRVQHHLHATAAEVHPTPDLARLAGLGERTFLRRFSKATGFRPTEYLQQVRIARAREALELSNRPVDQIAWQVGYQDPSAFRKVFRKTTGLAPNLYRRRFGVA